jgi:transcriptional regulator of acetoin/glycerol metabolism
VAASRLTEQRRRLERAWQDRFAGEGHPDDVRPEISTSWDRSAAATSVALDAAPVDEGNDPAVLWRNSRLRPAIEAVEDEIRELTSDRGFVAAVMDDNGRILWTAGGRHMRMRAERVNFAPGGRWDEASVGTNALALALDEDRPAQVFSAEHYAAMVHGWCCFAAPLRDPATGLPLGVLDLSSTWERAHPMALATVRALALAAQAVLDAQAVSDASPADGASRRTVAAAQPPSTRAVSTQIRVLGSREASRSGVVVPLALRQAEIVALLALAPDGLTPEQLHDRMYGEEPVSVTTTKAEVSHLRALLGGGISQRLYRLDERIVVDVAALVAALRDGDTARVAELYTGPLLPSSESPMVREWREVLQVGVRDIAIRSGHSALADRLPYDEAVQQAAAAVLDPTDARIAWAHARIARATRP